jgi:excinuclease ABC subunit C
MVCFRDGVPDKESYRKYRITSTNGQNDFASMAEVVRRRYSRVLKESARRARAREKAVNENASVVGEADESGVWIDLEAGQENALEGARRAGANLPDLIIVDGGKGQLSSACTELQRLGLHEIPIIGLAKEFEEIYRPGISEPLALPHSNGGLRLLQRIRDEAHRFANEYHQLLLKRRVAESVLDDCPGVSKTRKKLLLSTFGSVARLRQATQEEIAAVEGVSARLAGEILEFLRKRD